MRKSSSCSTTCLRVKCMTAGGLPSNYAPYTDCALRNCGTSGSKTGQAGQNSGPSIKSRWAAPKEPRQNRGDCIRCFCVMPMVPPLIGTSRHGCRWVKKLPPLNREGDGGQALNQYLRRRKVWMALRDEAEHQGEQLTPYSFRHRYAKQSHAAQRGRCHLLPPLRQWDHHTIEVHLKSSQAALSSAGGRSVTAFWINSPGEGLPPLTDGRSLLHKLRQTCAVARYGWH